MADKNVKVEEMLNAQERIDIDDSQESYGKFCILLDRKIKYENIYWNIIKVYIVSNAIEWKVNSGPY